MVWLSIAAAEWCGWAVWRTRFTVVSRQHMIVNEPFPVPLSGFQVLRCEERAVKYLDHDFCILVQHGLQTVLNDIASRR